MFQLLRGLVTSKVGKVLVGLLTLVAMFFSLVQYGRRVERTNTKFEKLEQYTATKERIEDVESSPTRDAAIERLRGNGLIR